MPADPPDFGKYVMELSLSIPRDDLLLKDLSEEEYIAVIHRILRNALAVLHAGGWGYVFQGLGEACAYECDARGQSDRHGESWYRETKPGALLLVLAPTAGGEGK